jgi:hypothetical protein
MSIFDSVGRAFGKKATMLKVQAIFRDGSVGLEFMIQNLAEGEEMRQQLLTYDCVAEVRIVDEPEWVSL